MVYDLAHGKNRLKLANGPVEIEPEIFLVSNNYRHSNRKTFIANFFDPHLSHTQHEMTHIDAS